jgi:hypothetical protein
LGGFESGDGLRNLKGFRRLESNCRQKERECVSEREGQRDREEEEQSDHSRYSLMNPAL